MTDGEMETLAVIVRNALSAERLKATDMDDYRNPLPKYTYISPSLAAFGDSERRVRIATKLIEHPDSYAFAQLKSEIVLRHKEDAKSCITAKFFEDDRGIFVLSIQGYTVATMKPHNASFSFVGDEIGKLVEFLKHIQSMPLNRPIRRISDEDLRRVALSAVQTKMLVAENQEAFAEAVRSGLTKEDVVAVAYRKEQLKVFERLLEDADYFDRLKTQKRCGSEALWQKFFEKNPWIFGYGLSYIYLSGLDEKRLEQYVLGHSVSEHGKRVDALLRTRGLISSLCFAEIKTHRSDLLVENKAYRSGCWAPSAELAGAVSQVQNSVMLATQAIRKLTVKDERGDPTGEEAYNWVPKAFLVIGSLGEFTTPYGVNEERFRSFELFRRNTLSPEIITFDELHDRARFIVQQHDRPPE